MSKTDWKIFAAAVIFIALIPVFFEQEPVIIHTI